MNPSLTDSHDTPSPPSIRVVNLRGDSEWRATEHDYILPVHRQYRGPSSILGNPFPFSKPSFSARQKSIDRFKQWFHIQLQEQTPVYTLLMQEIDRALLHPTQPIALECFCAPAPCHAHVIAQWMREEFQRRASLSSIPAAPPPPFRP